MAQPVAPFDTHDWSSGIPYIGCGGAADRTLYECRRCHVGRTERGATASGGISGPYAPWNGADTCDEVIAHRAESDKRAAESAATWAKEKAEILARVADGFYWVEGEARFKPALPFDPDTSEPSYGRAVQIAFFSHADFCWYVVGDEEGRAFSELTILSGPIEPA